MKNHIIKSVMTIFFFVIIIPEYNAQMYQFKRPFLDKYQRFSENGKWGIADLNDIKKIIVAPKYSYVFSDVVWKKFIIVNNGGELSKYSEQGVFGGKYGMIDEAGNEVLPLKYDWIEGPVIAKNTKQEIGWGENEFITVYGGQWGAINEEGKEVIPLGKYDYLYAINFPGKFGRADTSYYYFSNKGGSWIKNDQGYYIISGGKWFILNEKGEEMMTVDCDYIWNDGIYKGEKYGEFDRETYKVKWAE